MGLSKDKLILELGARVRSGWERKETVSLPWGATQCETLFLL
jgi:hypothetical protein